MKVGYSLPQQRVITKNQNINHAGMVGLKQLQKDTVSFKAYEEEFDRDMMEYVNHHSAVDTLAQNAYGWMYDVDKNDPRVKETLLKAKKVLETHSKYDRNSKYVMLGWIEEEIFGKREIFPKK